MIVNVVLAVVIVAMIYITLHSSNANVINYEVNLQDKYASWQEELQSQEESLNARERALNQLKIILKNTFFNIFLRYNRHKGKKSGGYYE